MKKLSLAALVLALVTTSTFADIQDPPANEYGPTRKLGRGLSNVLFGISEFPVQIARVNEREGNSAALGYGLVRGISRSYMRIHAGLFEMFSFPLPVNAGTYYPILPSHIRYIHGGYEEFPPELGNESKYPYVRHD
ncbi:MAG TPA: exosortase system-associated protein, TIGR04073 family [Chthoniobacterales bacterium]|jgi:putative exosortase-associated protein (TIGR04073 family)|nr:exosortase system-associated protein, TIGR04073 family [Chthoniobacterales bacterium]